MQPPNQPPSQPPNQPQSQKSYTTLKYLQASHAATSRMIEFFNLTQIKKYIDFESKTKFQKQLMEIILKQLRQFLRKKAVKQIESAIARGGEGQSFSQKLSNYDQIYFRHSIMSELAGKDATLQQISAFEEEDAEDWVIEQLESQLRDIDGRL